MTTRTISWTLDPPTPRQRPIDRTDLSIRVDASFPWTLHTPVLPAEEQKVVFQNVMPGTIEYQLLTYDDAGTPSDPPIELSKSMGWDAPTGPSNVTIIDEE